MAGMHHRRGRTSSLPGVGGGGLSGGGNSILRSEVHKPRTRTPLTSQLFVSSCPVLPLSIIKDAANGHGLMVGTGSWIPPLPWAYSSNFPFSYSPKFSDLFYVFGFQVGVLLGLFYLGSKNRSSAARQQRSCSGLDYRWVLSLSHTLLAATKIPELKLETEIWLQAQITYNQYPRCTSGGQALMSKINI
jgi:hypothetical protein